LKTEVTCAKATHYREIEEKQFKVRPNNTASDEEKLLINGKVTKLGVSDSDIFINRSGM
jgi:hypothetical protein